MRFLMLVLMLCVGIVAQAQHDTTLTLGESVTVQVTADDPAMLEFEGQAGQYLSLMASAQDAQQLDPVLEVLTPQMRQLAYSDDSRTRDDSISKEAQITALHLPEDGVYTVRVDSFNGVSEGAVEVILTQVDIFDTTLDVTAAQTTIISKLPEDTIFSHSYALEADAPISITVRDLSGTLDPVLRVHDRDGALLALNDDHATTDTTLNVFDAQIRDFTLADATDIRLEVVDFLGRAGTIEVIIMPAPE